MPHNRDLQIMSRARTIKLTEPLVTGGQKIAEVTVRPPKVKDLRSLDAHAPDSTDLTRGIEMAAILTGLTPAAIDEMDAADFAAISDVIAGFLPKPPEPGGGAR